MKKPYHLTQSQLRILRDNILFYYSDPKNSHLHATIDAIFWTSHLWPMKPMNMVLYESYYRGVIWRIMDRFVVDGIFLPTGSSRNNQNFYTIATQH